MRLRPKYKIELIKKVHEKIFKEYGTYALVLGYIQNFQICLDEHSQIYNFDIQWKENNSCIDLQRTLLSIPEYNLIEIAVDLEISIPMILPAFPTFVRTLTPEETGMSYAHEMFSKAYNSAYDDPADSIALANSTLETIIKHILEDPRTSIKYNERQTLYQLAETILKEFKFFPSKELQKNIKAIGSSLLCISSEIEDLRSDKTFSHGKGKTDYVVDNSLYSIFVINTITTVGLFIISYFEAKYGDLKPKETDIPF